MTLFAIFLVVLSAVVHAGWNLHSKKSVPTSSFFLIASFSGGAMLSPFLLIYGSSVLPAITPTIMACLTGSGFFLALYYAALAGAYRAGDISVAYPLARSSPVIVVTVVTLFLGRGEQVSTLCLAGILLVVAGCFLIPLKHFRDFHPRHYLTPTCLLALVAAIGTSGYSILDDEGLRILREASPASNLPTTLVYACIEAFAASAWLLLFIALRPKGRTNLRTFLQSRKRQSILAGFAIYVSYALVLLSLAYVDNISYVVGFRQLSIPLGAILGILILHESPHRPKIVGVTIMFSGLILIAVG